MTQPPPSDKPPPPPDQDSKPNWIDRIAQQSSGVAPPRAPEPSSDADRAEERRLWRLGGLGLQFAGTIAIFWFIGSRLDNYFGWPNVATLTAVVIAIVGNTYLLIKEAIKANRS